LEGRGLCPDHAPRMPPHLRLLMVSAMAAAGKFNAKVLQTLMGHSSITVTFDRCAHLMPGSEISSGWGAPCPPRLR
jgi:hypothetical protein